MEFPAHCHKNITIIEREKARKKNEKYDFVRPRVRLCTVVAFLRNDLRCRVHMRATSGVEEAVLKLIWKCGQPEVRDLEVTVLV